MRNKRRCGDKEPVGSVFVWFKPIPAQPVAASRNNAASVIFIFPPIIAGYYGWVWFESILTTCLSADYCFATIGGDDI